MIGSQRREMKSTVMTLAWGWKLPDTDHTRLMCETVPAGDILDHGIWNTE